MRGATLTRSSCGGTLPRSLLLIVAGLREKEEECCRKVRLIFIKVVWEVGWRTVGRRQRRGGGRQRGLWERVRS
jgi:hypothetical protein